jgi:NADH dehydrogenase [ubiquinone] 1 alpha subcomplex assembly factor 7
MRPAPSELALKIADLIKSTGPIGVHTFMAHALYDPRLGYYTQANPLGRDGDFITAPEITQMFGELIGLWAAQSWLDMGRPDPFNLIELGPGRGTLMADALRACSKVPGFLDAMQLHLVETNAPLKRLQAEALTAYAPQWHTALDQCPEGPCIILGNEFLDCLPVRQYVRGRDAWHEKLVGLDEDGMLCFGFGPEMPAPPASALKTDPEGCVREEAPGLAALVLAMAERLHAHNGRALFVDYGNPTQAPSGDTVQALYRHTKVSPLDHVGQADLTAHVDFHTLCAEAQLAGLRVDGPISQSHFLAGLGLHARATRLSSANPSQASALQEAVERLTGIGHMGGLFFAVCLSSVSIPSPPAGF